MAVPLPGAVSRLLVSIQPQATNGIRLIAESDLHITLHFLGTADVAVAAALRHVGAEPFTIRLDRPGHFSLKGRKTILWVGIEPSAALTGLHAATARALATVGFEPESRPYQPHVTVARLGRRAPRQVIDAFERALPNAADVEFSCSRFALFESRTLPEGARYSVIENFPLEAPA